MDAEHFAAEAQAHHRQLVRVVYLLSHDERLAEDAAQEALVRAWERVDRGESFESLAAWTTTVALNWTRTQLRRRDVEHRVLGRAVRTGRATRVATPSDDRSGSSPTREDAGPRRPTGRESEHPTGPLSSDVVAALGALPLRQREVVVLHYLLDQDLATIAEHAGISVGAVKNALFHGRRRLARALTRDDLPTAPAGPSPAAPLREDRP